MLDLRTTTAPQGKGKLETDGAFCCLGRLAVVVGAERKLGEGSVSYNGHLIDFGFHAPVFLTLKSGKILTTMNDSGHSTFPQIADWVETTILAELLYSPEGNPR